MASVASTVSEPSTWLKAAPATIGRFTLRGEIGRGSNGVVFAAQDPILAREVAIKALPLTRNGEFQSKIEAVFVNEAKAAGRLNHPHIVTIFDAGQNEDLAYIAMERLYGLDLHEFMAAGKKLTVQKTALLMARVADALHYAHKQGLVHRDIKPGNIFVQRDGKPKVLDFGVALAALHPNHSAQLIGTPNYMSPEQAQRQPIDARSDVFSLGTILYELLCGRRAFDGHSVEETLAQVIQCTPLPLEQLRPDVPPPLLAIVRKTLARDPAQRYATAGELRNALAGFAGRTLMRDEQRLPVTRRQPWQWAAAAGLLLLAIGAGTLLGRFTTTAEPTPIAAVPLEPTSPPPAASPPGAAAPGQAAASSVLPPVTPSPANPAPPPKDGTLTLAIAPWGEVVVDGEPRGVSPPLTQLNLKPGTYKVEVRNGSAKPYVAEVTVKPGQASPLRHKF
jgi:serine/threonine-protein kinase